MKHSGRTEHVDKIIQLQHISLVSHTVQCDVMQSVCFYWRS